MLSSKLLPEMEVDYNSKSEQWLQGMQNSPIFSQIEKLKARIDMTAAACESAEKFSTRQGPTTLPTLDKSLQEQQTLLRAAVNTIYIDFPVKVEINRIEYTPLTPAMVLDSNISRATSSIHRARY
ncbi:hypothetical protein NC652_020978 [Populus alba x Populus x berolinensis]|nr:hypothetical protein NC652_020978 [Populus alba x Populus x berolinensis]